MQITDVLARMGGLQSVARELGVTEDQVSQGADALLLGGLLGGQAGGARSGGLGGLLDMNGDGNALDDILNMAGRALR